MPSAWPAGVERGVVGVSALVDRPPAEQDGGGSDGQVDQEDRGPAEAVHEEAADDRPGEDGGAGAHAPVAEEAGSAHRVRLGLPDDRQGARDEEGRGHPLHGAAGDQIAQRRRQGAEEGAGQEERHADEEPAFPAVPVSQRAAGQHAGGQADGEGVDDPLAPRDGGVQVGLHGGERDGDDGEVEQGDEGGGERGDQRSPASRGGGQGHPLCGARFEYVCRRAQSTATAVPARESSTEAAMRSG